MQAIYAYIAFLTVIYGLGLDTAYLRLGRKEGKADDSAFGFAADTEVHCSTIRVESLLHHVRRALQRAQLV